MTRSRIYESKDKIDDGHHIPTIEAMHPNNLTRINISNCGLEVLGNLPAGLLDLDCSNNKIKEIKGLRRLNCSNNEYVDMTLPEGLRTLICRNNHIKKINN